MSNDQGLNEVRRLQQWVSDLQSGMYINCVYCGHRYGPDSEIPATMADVLKEHVETCPKHPMSKLREVINTIEHRLEEGHTGEQLLNYLQGLRAERLL